MKGIILHFFPTAKGNGFVKNHYLKAGTGVSIPMTWAIIR